MSNANKRETLLPNELNEELIFKLSEMIESLLRLNRLTVDVLAQYTNVEQYEQMMRDISAGNDVIIE